MAASAEPSGSCETALVPSGPGLVAIPGVAPGFAASSGPGIALGADSASSGSPDSPAGGTIATSGSGSLSLLAAGDAFETADLVADTGLITDAGLAAMDSWADGLTIDGTATVAGFGASGSTVVSRLVGLSPSEWVGVMSRPRGAATAAFVAFAVGVAMVAGFDSGLSRSAKKLSLSARAASAVDPRSTATKVA